MVEQVRRAGAQPLAESCAERLQGEILDGLLLPGQRLDEVALGHRLEVSRNTLREAFRLLAREQLVEHVPHRGVFVSEVDSRQARQVYEVRRQLELGSLESLQARITSGEGGIDEDLLDEVGQACTEGERARARNDWVGVGSANSRFHLALVALGGNEIALRLMRILASLTRLRFLAVADARSVHEKFIDDNRRIYELLTIGEVGRARAALELYLLRAESELA